MGWYHWTRHTWFSIDIYSNHMSNAHRLALIINVLFYLSSLGPNYENYVHRITPTWLWTLKWQKYPIYVESLPTSPKFHSVTVALLSLVFQIIEFCFTAQATMVYFSVFRKKKSLKSVTQNFKNPKRSFVRTIGGKIQDNFQIVFECDCRSSVLKFSLPWDPMVTKTKNIRKKSKKKKIEK